VYRLVEHRPESASFDNLSAFCDAWDVAVENRYTNHEAMLATVELDLVSICTPAVFHHDHVLDAVDGGVGAVLCEKPIASSLEEATEMVEACESAEVDFVVNYTLRFTEKFQRLREHVRSGEALGDVRSVTVQSRMELARNATHVLDLLTFLFDDEIDAVWGHVTGENESVEALSPTSTTPQGGRWSRWATSTRPWTVPFRATRPRSGIGSWARGGS
jgi:predicted dehydrogenase